MRFAVLLRMLSIKLLKRATSLLCARFPLLHAHNHLNTQVVAVRLLQKAWTDSHLFGLLVMSMYFLVALSVLVAFGASHDKDIDWALKESVCSVDSKLGHVMFSSEFAYRYLDNFADACSIATIGLSFYGASLVQFNFRVRHFQGQFAAEFRASAQAMGMQTACILHNI
jgi:hypothetical protein